MRPECPEILAKVSWQEVIGFDAEDFGEGEEFQVGNAAFLVFQGGDGVAAQIPAGELELEGESVLAPAFAQAQFADVRADNVQE